MISDTDWALLDARLNKIERSLGILQACVDRSLKEKYHGADGIALTKTQERPCVFDGMSPEDRMKAVSVYCPCPKCSPYALSSGSLVDAGLKQQWQHTHKGEE